MLLSAAVLVATVVAFAVAERLKLEPSPILHPHVTEVFSPVCRCPQRRAQVAFTLRKGGDVSVAIVDAGGKIVRTLRRRRHERRGDRVSATWDGRDDHGRVLPTALYRPRIELGRRTIVMPNRIQIDVRRPTLRVTKAAPRVISPDGDGRLDGVTIGYQLDEPARVVLRVGGIRYEERRGLRTSGTFRWFGKLRGRALRQGVYPLALVATDLAGNRSAPSRPIAVRIRFVQLARRTIRARAATRFGVRVRTDARFVTWTLAHRSGRARPGLLVLRAPKRAGRYTLIVSANGHAASARVVVSPRRASASKR